MVCYGQGHFLPERINIFRYQVRLLLQLDIYVYSVMTEYVFTEPVRDIGLAFMQSVLKRRAGACSNKRCRKLGRTTRVYIIHYKKILYSFNKINF